MNGKGRAPEKGYNRAAYRTNYDAIFRKQLKTMKTNQPGLEQPTVLPWHREAAKEIHPWELRNEGDGTIEEMELAYDENEANMNEDERVAAIIARHDPHAAQHATTLRLLEEALDCISISDGTCHVIQEHVDIREQIRAHLAAMKGSQ